MVRVPPSSAIACTALSIRLVHTWFSSAGWAGTSGKPSAKSLTTVIRPDSLILCPSMTRVLCRPSRMSMSACAARSSWEYCLAAPTRAEIRSVESSISSISCSVSSA